MIKNNKHVKTMERVAAYNTVDRTLLKVAEECNELGEVMIKRVIKSDRLKPPIEKLVEEMGDVMFRIMVAATKLGIEEAVEDRIEAKSAQLEEWIDLEMYKGGV